MNPAYGTSGDWRALAGVAGLHCAALAVLLGVEPRVEAVQMPQTLMVSLLSVAPAPEPVPAPPPPAPRPPAVKPPTPVPVLAAPARTQTDTIPVELPKPEAAPAPTPAPPVAEAAAKPAPVPPPQPAAASAPAPVGAAPAPVAMLPPRFDADYLHNPAPVYPPMSRRLREQGRVLLRVFVTADGLPARVEMRDSSGYPRLDAAALESVRRWRFAPARRGDRAVEDWVLVPFSFSLRS